MAYLTFKCKLTAKKFQKSQRYTNFAGDSYTSHVDISCLCMIYVTEVKKKNGNKGPPAALIVYFALSVISQVLSYIVHQLPVRVFWHQPCLIHAMCIPAQVDLTCAAVGIARPLVCTPLCRCILLYIYMYV